MEGLNKKLKFHILQQQPDVEAISHETVVMGLQYFMEEGVSYSLSLNYVSSGFYNAKTIDKAAEHIYSKIKNQRWGRNGPRVKLWSKKIFITAGTIPRSNNRKRDFPPWEYTCQFSNLVLAGEIYERVTAMISEYYKLQNIVLGALE